MHRVELTVLGILNTISTVSMIRLGRPYGDLMVEVGASNDELRARARRTVELANELAAATGGAVRGAVEDA